MQKRLTALLVAILFLEHVMEVTIRVFSLRKILRVVDFRVLVKLMMMVMSFLFVRRCLRILVVTRVLLLVLVVTVSWTAVWKVSVRVLQACLVQVHYTLLLLLIRRFL